jgi:photosystem II stability/assembly factor-like uncharacterized protein/flagellar hook assembly protein FlgD
MSIRRLSSASNRSLFSSRIPPVIPGVGLALILGAGLMAAQQGPRSAPAPAVQPTQLASLHWRSIGPTGGRTDSIAGEPGNPLVAYVGAASGGVWRTLDGGIDWKPVLDDIAVSAIGALAVAPSAPEQVWAGTGETFYIRAYTAMGNGVYKSTDRGSTWKHSGLDDTGRISRIIVDPRDADLVYVCALGSAYGPQQQRGVFRTTDGGQSWKRLLFVNDQTGCSDMAISPADSKTLFAGMWRVQIRTWDLKSGGPGSGLFVTHDGGETWSRVEGGLPDQDVGKTSVDIALSDPSRVYTLMEGRGDPSLYRSDDGGRTWRLMNHSHGMVQRAPYYTRLRVAADNPDRIYFLSTNFSMSDDGGKTVEVDQPTAADDNHDLWIDPKDPHRILLAYDHGVMLSPDGGKSWERTKLPLAQMYHVATDNATPYNVYSNRQDGPAYMGPSRTREGSGPTEGNWRHIAGCESGFAIPDTVHHRVWGGCYNGQLEFTDLDDMQTRSVDVWPMSAVGWEPKDVKERFYWVFPIALSPHDPSRVYVGSQYVNLTTDGGTDWHHISPDLTRNEPTHQTSSTGLTVDNLMTFDGATLFSLAESPVQAGVLWAGSNDGLVHVSRNAGTSWTDVTAKMPGVPHWGWISSIEPSHFDAGTAYVTVDDHMSGDFNPYVYKTADYGQSWTSVVGDLPHGGVTNNVHMVAEDPGRRGLLYAATESGVYFSLDDGAHWNSLQSDLPRVPAYWIAIQPQFHDLVLATYGRGIWILDDVSSIEQMNADNLSAAVHLFQPRDTYRFQPVASHEAEIRSQMKTEDPPEGVPIDYWLGAGARSRVTLEVLDGSGHLVRTLEGTDKPGLNRVWWDLRHEPRREVTLRMPPPNAPWRIVPPEGLPSQQWGGRFRNGARVVPGTYTIRIKADGQQQTRQMQVLKDPVSHGTLPDIRAQVALSQKVQTDVNRVVDAVNQLEETRKQLDDLTRSLSQGATRSEAERLLKLATEIEDMFMDVHRPGGAEEFATPMKLYGRMIHLMTRLDDSADYAPTEPDKQVADALNTQLSGAQERFGGLMHHDIAVLNEQLAKEGKPIIK